MNTKVKFINFEDYCRLCGHKICCGTTEYNGSIGIKESDIKTGTLSI